MGKRIEKISAGKIETEIEYFGKFNICPDLSKFKLLYQYQKVDYDEEKKFLYGYLFDPFDEKLKNFFYVKVDKEKIFCKILGDFCRETNEFIKKLDEIVKKWEKG